MSYSAARMSTETTTLQCHCGSEADVTDDECCHVCRCDEHQVRRRPTDTFPGCGPTCTKAHSP